jgi:hypothetical protein
VPIARACRRRIASGGHGAHDLGATMLIPSLRSR